MLYFAQINIIYPHMPPEDQGFNDGQAREMLPSISEEEEAPTVKIEPISSYEEAPTEKVEMLETLPDSAIEPLVQTDEKKAKALLRTLTKPESGPDPTPTETLEGAKLKALHEEEAKIEAEFNQLGFFGKFGVKGRRLKQRRARVVSQIAGVAIKDAFKSTEALGDDRKFISNQELAGAKIGTALQGADQLPKSIKEAGLKTTMGEQKWGLYQTRLAELEAIQQKRGALSGVPWSARREKKRLDTAIRDKQRQVNAIKNQYEQTA
jgi:hypothetical protein